MNDIMKADRVHPGSILDLAAGAVPERVQEAFKKVMDNILDPQHQGHGQAVHHRDLHLRPG